MPDFYKQLDRSANPPVMVIKPWIPKIDPIKRPKSNYQKKTPSEKVRGVVADGSRFKAYVFVQGKQKTIGRFDTQMEAIKARQDYIENKKTRKR